MGEVVLVRDRGRSQPLILKSIFDGSGMCLAKLDASTRLVEVNSDFSRQFDCEPAELNGSRFSDLLHVDARAKVSRQFICLIARQRPRFTEPMVPFHQKNSTVFSAELTGFPVRGDGDRIDGLMALIRPAGESENERAPGNHKVLLTDVDARILEGVAAGVSTVRLAANLYMSQSGVEYHVNVLRQRLKVNNRPALISKAYYMGLLRTGWPPRVNPDCLET